MNQTIVFCHMVTVILIKERYTKTKTKIPVDVKVHIDANTDFSQHPKEGGNTLYHDLYNKVLTGRGHYVKKYPQCWTDAGRHVASGASKKDKGFSMKKEA